MANDKKEMTLTRVENRLCVALTGQDKRVCVFEKEVCVTLFELDPTDKLAVMADHDVDLHEPAPGGSEKPLRVLTVKEYRDRFGQQPQALLEQFDGDRFWFTSLGKARHFAGVHGLLEVPDTVMQHLRADAEK